MGRKEVDLWCFPYHDFKNYILFSYSIFYSSWEYLCKEWGVTKTFSILMSWFPWYCLTNPSLVNTIMQVVIVSMARVHVGNNKWRAWELGKVIKRPCPSQLVLKRLSSQQKNTNINDHNCPRSFFCFSLLFKNTLDIFFVESGVHCVMGLGGRKWDGLRRETASMQAFCAVFQKWYTIQMIYQ